MHSINMALHVFCIIHIIFAQIKATYINHVEDNDTGFAYPVFKKNQILKLTLNSFQGNVQNNKK